MSAGNEDRRVLLGEDDLEIRSYLETALKCQGYSVEVAQDGEEVLSSFRNSSVPISAIILDVILPRRDGMDALKEIRRFDSATPIIMIDGTASSRNVAIALKNGATDFLAKPVNPDELRRALNAVLAPGSSPARKTVDTSAAEADHQVFFGTSREMRSLQEMIRRIGWSDTPILILGETGVGKEVLAREMHANSPRAKKSILKINCAALPSELVESELFGYERGAFTGAFQKKPGMFELADGATILLDEIGDMDVRLQAKLLQVLQDHEFQRLGGRDTIRVDVRVIAATHRDLKKAIAENTFREDLYYRLNVINVRIPPLRERRDDIIPLAEFLIRKHTAPDATPAEIPPTLGRAFVTYDWPGNIRELENVIRKFLVLQDAIPIEQELNNQILGAPAGASTCGSAAPDRVEQAAPQSVAALPELVSVPSSQIPVLEQLERAKRTADRNAILAALKTTNWNRRQAAVLLHIDYKALLYKMKGLSIKKEKQNPASDRKEAQHATASAVGETGLPIN